MSGKGKGQAPKKIVSSSVSPSPLTPERPTEISPLETAVSSVSKMKNETDSREKKDGTTTAIVEKKQVDEEKQLNNNL